MELELKGNHELPKIVNEYAYLRIKKPQPSPGTPHTMGVWVKGNSGWGIVVFEFVDAKGEVFRSYGGYHDWPAYLSVNFDGWHFIAYPIDRKRSTMKNTRLRSHGGDRKVDYPITMTGLFVSQSRCALDPTEMKAVSPILRFKNLGTFE